MRQFHDDHFLVGGTLGRRIGFETNRKLDPGGWSIWDRLILLGLSNDREPADNVLLIRIGIKRNG